tara:strand:+ start:6600 stop:7391 length:792 start_codon:yes stop_codon:yes gene_type:complete
MIKDWSLDTIKNEINKIAYGESDPRMDGYTTFGCKQDLYKVLFHVQEKLNNCSTYEGERGWAKAAVFSPVFEKDYPRSEAVNRQEPYDETMKRMHREEDARQLKWDQIHQNCVGRQLKWDQRFMEMCKMIAKWSKDPSSQIGAVAVNDERRILATGYNGFPKGIADTEERLNDREEKYPRIVHAETNALMNALYAGVSLKDATMYVHGLPVCPECAKLIIQAGVRRVVINDLVNSNAHWKDLWITRTSPMFKEAGIVVMILGE